MTVTHNVVIALLAASNAYGQGTAPPVLPLRLTRPTTTAEAAAPVVIPFEFLANRPLVRVTINGQGPFALLIAPDDQRSRIDPELAELLKLKLPEGAAELTVELGFGASVTAKVPMVIEDISRVTPEFPATMRPRGIVSLSAWTGQLVTLDFSRWRMTIEPGALPEPNLKDVFASTASGEVLLPLSVGGQTIDCLVDPWFPGGLVLPSTSLGELDMLGEPRDGGTFRTKEGVLRVREGRLASDIMVGPFEMKTPLVLLSDRLTTATVGTSWLSRFAVTYDVAQGRVRLERQSSGKAGRGQN